MNISEKLTTIAENQKKVFDAGKKTQYDKFWDVFQDFGETLVGIDASRYNYAFSYNKFDDNTFSPKYPILISSNGSHMTGAFRGNTLITNTKVPIRISTNNPQIEVYMNGSFMDCTNLETIVELYFGEKAYTTDSCFQNCTSLKNLNITGTIIKNFNVKWCPLTKESIESVINALSEDVSDQTVSFSKTAKERAFTDDEWSSLIATKPNWSFSLV